MPPAHRDAISQHTSSINAQKRTAAVAGSDLARARRSNNNDGGGLPATLGSRPREAVTSRDTETAPSSANDGPFVTRTLTSSTTILPPGRTPAVVRSVVCTKRANRLQRTSATQRRSRAANRLALFFIYFSGVTPRFFVQFSPYMCKAKNGELQQLGDTSLSLMASFYSTPSAGSS